ncbi:MAG: hypothetical protein ACTSYU_05905 [Promethearchaeota archaeon]
MVEENIEIYKFWIIHTPSGICIFDQTFQDLPVHVDADLTAGYLFAITSLFQEITQQDIHFLQLEKLRFVYGISQHFMMVMLTHNSISTHDASMMLHDLKIKFTKKYEPSILRSQINEVSQFHAFARVVEQTFNMESKYFHILEKRSEDLEGFFQSATDEWMTIQKSISNRAKKMGSWILHNTQKLTTEIQNDLISTREQALKHESQSNTDDDPDESKNSWV